MLFFFYISIYRSNQRRCSVEKGVYKNFTNFIRKHRRFPVKFAKFLKTPILRNICERLLLNLSGILRSSMKRFLRNMQMEKPIFKMGEEYDQKQRFES